MKILFALSSTSGVPSKRLAISANKAELGLEGCGGVWQARLCRSQLLVAGGGNQALDAEYELLPGGNPHWVRC